MEKRSVAGIVLRDGKVLVGKRREGGMIGLRWEFPGGKVEFGESDEIAIEREFMEELGIRVCPLRCIGTSRFQSPSGLRVLAAWLVMIEATPDFSLKEHSEVRWVDPPDLFNMDLAESDRGLLKYVLKALG
jgi:8-oxo-dGTP diphosphatase